MHMNAADADLDIAVIGAGIAGLYCASRLVGANPAAGRLEVFESSQRAGGRIHTVFSAAAPKLALELGAQTLLADHDFTHRLLADFGIATSERPPEPQMGLVSLRGRTRTNRQIRRSRFFRPFNYDVSIRLQRKGPSGIMRKALAEFDRRRTDDLMPAASALDARLLEVLSEEEVQYLCDRTGYSFWRAPLDAKAMFEWSARELFVNARAILQVPSGMSALIEKLVASIRHRGGEVSTGQRLVAIEPNGMQPVTLRLRDGANRLRTVRARRVVLALPRQAIRHIEGFADRSPIRHLVDAIHGWSILKGAILYPTAWWRQLGFTTGHSQTDLPIGLLDHLSADTPGNAERASSALTFYIDSARTDYWRNRFAPLPTDRWLEASHPLTLELHRVIAALYEPLIGKALPSPLEAIVIDWQNEPFGGAFHMWTSNASPTQALRLARQPSPDEPIHICGEAWSTRQGWIEGALESVEQTLALLRQ
jgi:lysine 2-monooxygenase